MLTSRHKKSKDDHKHALAKKIVKNNMFVGPKCQVGQE